MAFDLVISGALVYPGEGEPSHVDVGLSDGTIAAVEPSLSAADAEILDASGLVLCPGFIDMHAHSALRTFDDPILLPKIAQGFTTEVIHPDGLAPAPVAADRRSDRQVYLRGLEGSGPETWWWSTFEEYLDALEQTQPATTLVPSAGHNAVRDHVMGGERRAPEPAELERMRREIRLALEAGGRTLSFGLIYLPGAFSATEELVALAEEAARFGAPLVPHVRNESGGVLEAIGEMIGVARRSGAPLHVSHLKSRADEGLIAPMLELLEAASEDIEVSFDQYPYGGGSTMLSALLPAWAQEGGAAGTLQRLEAAAERERMAGDMRNGLPGWENIYGTLGADRLRVANAAPPHREVVGMTLAQAADHLAAEPADAVVTLLRDCALDVTILTQFASDAAVRQIASHRLQMIGSDAIFSAHPHPRVYGTAPRFLGRLVMREGLLPVAEGVARLTARPAARLGLHDRGRIEPGKRADLVLVDPVRFADTGSYDDPIQLPDGVVSVWVAGQVVCREGQPTGARPGGVIRDPLPVRG